MKTVFVPAYDWNAHYASPEECLQHAQQCGELKEDEEFQLVRLEVHALTTYRVVDGKPVPVKLAFPLGIEPA